MRRKPNSCSGCSFESHGTDFSQIEGTGSSGVMLIGEASGEMEARDQLPFRPYAPAGSLLERTLRRMGIDRQQFSISNVCRCRPRNNWLEGNPAEYSALTHCRPNLEAAIIERKPRCIVALGGTALRELTGMTGENRGISHLAGYILPHVVNTGLLGAPLVTIPVIANFHPTFLRRGKASLQGVFARILQRALNIASGKDTSYKFFNSPTRRRCDDCISFENDSHDPSCFICGGTGYIEEEGSLDARSLGYQTSPTVSDAESFAHYVLGHPESPESYDLETVESPSLDEDAREGFADTHIRLVQFAIDGAGAIAIPYERDFYQAIQALLHAPNTKCGHNVWLFDNKVLKAAGAREGIDLAPRGIVHDTLQMFHHWQPDLPAHLQFCAGFVNFPFPWKHLSGSNLALYGCADVDATLRLFNMLQKTLIRDGLWNDA